jgi:hypothetical protein
LSRTVSGSSASGKKAVGSAHSAAWNLISSRPNEIWSYDFVAARTADGGALRILNVVDEYTRVALGCRVDRSIGAADVIEELEALFSRHGRPKLLRSDNGREFIASSLADWLQGQGVAQAFIEKGAPQQNAYVERFNGTMRDEVLNGESFHSVLEARVVLQRWLVEYNTLRPHRRLRCRHQRRSMRASKRAADESDSPHEPGPAHSTPRRSRSHSRRPRPVQPTLTKNGPEPAAGHKTPPFSRKVERTS